MSARSYLYVPGSRPDRFDKAATSGADAIILDLEDAVPFEGKAEARSAVAEWLKHATPGVEVWVRVNSGALLGDDLAALKDVTSRISLPKVSSASDLELLDAALGDTAMDVIALIETASGVLDAPAIARAPRVVRLAIGEADLAGELGIEPSDDAREFSAMRAQVVLASAAAGLDQPVGSVTTDFTDLEAARASSAVLRKQGFGARAAIHPAQVAVINEVFTPSEDELKRARRLLELFEAAGGGVCTDDDGRMVDEAIVRSARRIVARAR